MAIGIFATIFGLALFFGLGSVIVVSARRRGSGAGAIDSRAVRQFFQYALLYALFVVVAIGASELLGRAFGATPAQWQDGGQELAQALAYALVGGPLAAALAWWTWRSHRRDPSETTSILFVVYLTITALTAVIVAAVSLQTLIFQAIDRTRFDPDAAGQLLAWGALWLGHWIVSRRTLTAERATPHLLLGSLTGLVMAVAGLVMTLGNSLDLLLRPVVVLHPGTGLANGAGLLIAGGLVWVRYWTTAAAHLQRGVWWLAYVLPIAVGGGLIMSLVAASRLLWSVLVWFFGDRLGQTASQHFDSAAFEVASVMAGVLVLWYHQAVLGSGRDVRNEIRRVYEYLLSGIALVTAAFGVGTVIVALIEAATGGVDVGMTTMNTLLAAVTLLAVGVPVWWVFWRQIRIATAAAPASEVVSPTRRVYLVVLFGVAGVAAVVAVIAVAFTGFQDLVNAQVGLVTLRSMRYGLGVLVGAAAVSAYHAAVFRQDRLVAVPERVAGPHSVVLVGAFDPDIERVVRHATGARVELWGLLDGSAQPWQTQYLLAVLAGFADRDLLVIAEGPGLRVLVIDPSGGRVAASGRPEAPGSPPRHQPAAPPAGDAQPS